MTYKIDIELTKTPKQKPDPSTLVFGHVFTDHMFVMDYSKEKGWHDAKIVPYGPIEMDPSTMVLHYGQAVFEGMKAFKSPEGKVLLFRPLRHAKRLNISNERMCIPEIDPEFVVKAIKTLIDIDRDWIPTLAGTSLYIRPFIISTDPYVGVRPSNTYKFMVILSPVGAYYASGINPVGIYVETKYTRAAKGGTGHAKTPANYASSLKAQMEAKEKGYSQVLWLDSIEKKYIEEVGTMNVFFKINGQIITPTLEVESILSGVTRASVIELLKTWGINVIEKKISIDEVFEAHKSGQLEEVFGTGTAAVISPVGELFMDGNKIIINDNKTGELSKKIYDTITDIQAGKLPDTLNWTEEV